VGHLNLTLIEVQPLEDAVEQAICLGPATEEARCLVASCVHLRAVRLVLMAGQWDKLQRYVDYADGVASRFGAGPVDPELLLAAAQEQQEQEMDAGSSAVALVPEWQRSSAGRFLGIMGQMGEWAVVSRMAEESGLAAVGSTDPAHTLPPGVTRLLPFDVATDGLASLSLGELRVCQAELDNRAIIVRLSEGLSSGAAQGPTGHLDVSHIDTEGLEAAIRFAESVGCTTIEARQVLATARVIVKLREALQSHDWVYLEQVIAEARGKVLASIVAPEMRAAQDELDNRAVLVELTQALSRGRPQGQTGRLYTGSVELHPLE